jgi:hypothetical protein
MKPGLFENPGDSWAGGFPARLPTSEIRHRKNHCPTRKRKPAEAGFSVGRQVPESNGKAGIFVHVTSRDTSHPMPQRLMAAGAVFSGLSTPRFSIRIRSAAVATACLTERISLRIHHQLSGPGLIPASHDLQAPLRSSGHFAANDQSAARTRFAGLHALVRAIFVLDRLWRGGRNHRITGVSIHAAAELMVLHLATEQRNSTASHQQSKKKPRRAEAQRGEGPEKL